MLDKTTKSLEKILSNTETISKILIYNKYSEYYHKNFRKLIDKNYHIEHKWKKASIKETLR